jgi:hypothetical protein
MAVRRFTALLVLASAAACTSAGSSSTGSDRIASSARAREAAPDSADGPSELKLPQEQVPAEVRAIETQIDKRAVLMADEIHVEVSRNYEWDVSLTGDAVSPQTPSGTGHQSEAIGSARASVRNLDLRATKKIVFWKSGFGVTPFIKITARGNVGYVEADSAGGQPKLRRAQFCRIANADLAFDDDVLRREIERATAADGK